MPQPLITVTGATGAVGSMVTERLADLGANLRVIVRDAQRAQTLSGVDIATASDYLATDEMTEALRGTDVLFLVSGRESENRLEQHYSAIDAAVAAGVSRVIYTSFVGAAPDAVFTLGRTHYATERALEQSGMAFVIQRQNLYLDFIPRMTDGEGVIRGPAGDGRFAPVARTDVADVAVQLLTDDRFDGSTLNVTGDERVSLRHLANRMAALTGKPIEYVQETTEEAFASRSHFGAPAWEVEGWVSSYLAIAAGELDVVSDTVAELTGRSPIHLDRFLVNNPESWQHIKPAGS